MKALLILKAWVMIGIILYAGIGLGPDEAQYWTWSRHLDGGYYSKPPAIAWQIFATTQLIGSTELGVRLGAVIIGTLFAWVVYRLALKVDLSENAAFLAGCLAALTPLGIFSTFLAITDGGMLLFWTLALTEIAMSLESSHPPSYLRFGLWIACGALFKWPIYLLWLAVIPLLRYPQYRQRALLGGLLISLLGLAPSLYWNIQHDWATFRHVTTIVQGGNTGSQGNPLEFMGSQILLLSPLVALLLIFGWFKIKAQKPSVQFLGLLSLGILLLFIVYSLFKKGQGNWCLFAYPSAFVFLAAVWEQRKSWLAIALTFSVALALFVFSIPTLQRFSLASIPWKINPFKHNVGWETLRQLPFDPEKQFLFADKYQLTSILSFYNAHQEEAFFFNLLGTRKNQFSYWSGAPINREGLFLAVENGLDVDEKLHKMHEFYRPLLAPHFDHVGPATLIPLFSANGIPVKKALLIPCQGYRGTRPEDPEKY